MNKNSLTEGSVIRGLFLFLLPLMLGQFLQQLYNVADAWVIGNFADNTSFAAVSSCGNLSFLIVGFFTGLSNGAGVVIARHYGARDYDKLKTAIQTTVSFGLIASAVTTLLTTVLSRHILVWMKTPDNVLPLSSQYFSVYCLGISTVIMYNLFMALMRAMGDSIRPLVFLFISSVVNVILDLLFVAVFHLGCFGAALATVLAQGLSALLCFFEMQRNEKNPFLQIHFADFKNTENSFWGIHIDSLKEIITQGLPSGLQNSALSLGNVVVQSHINSFGEYAMAGHGADAKIEGFVFIPILCISMALSTFVSQNRGAGGTEHWKRMKKGILISIGSSLVIAQSIGVILYIYSPVFLRFFTTNTKSIAYGVTFTRTVTIFYMALAFCHASSGVLQGMGKSIYAMLNMLSIWCIVRIIYVTIALHFHHEFYMISWAYPLTWTISAFVFIIMLIKQSRITKMEMGVAEFIS